MEEKIKRQYCVCGSASKWAVTSGVPNACQWESTCCLSLKGVSHTHVNVSVRLTHMLCSEAAEENQLGTVPWSGFLIPWRG